jgi:cysteine-rich repeat protein
VQDSAGLGYTSPIVVKVSNISAQGVANHGALCDKNASCQCLLGFSGDDCSIAPPSACGDGIVGDGEECDDGNNNETDGCMSTCKTATTTQCVRDDNNTKQIVVTQLQRPELRKICELAAVHWCSNATKREESSFASLRRSLCAVGG